MTNPLESPSRFVFTKERLDAFGPHPADSRSMRGELCDAMCVGLRLAVGRSDPPHKTWFFRYRWRGKKRIITLGPYEGLTVKKARERVYELRAMLARGEDPSEAKRARAAVPTVSEFVDEYYLPHAQATVRSVDTIVSRLRTGITPYFGDRQLDAISRRDIMLFMNTMKEKTSATTANHHFILIRRLMNLAVQWEMIRRSPCTGIKKFKQPSGRDRYLSKEEVRRFLNATSECPNAVVASLFRLLLFTGLRFGEAVSLRFDVVCQETKSVRLIKTKAGTTRRVYLSSYAWAEIELMTAQRKDEHPFLFPGRRPDTHLCQPAHQFVKIIGKAKITDFRIHDLRHTFASHMVQSGATLFEVQNALGHASSEMTQRYAHLSHAGLRERAESAAKHCTSMMSVENHPA